jgi:uncharacterized protein DUF1552
MIFKKALPRRTFLRGIGATLALPLLDGMFPAFAATVDTTPKPATRLGFVYVPNGIIMQKWTPTAEGDSFELTPTLEPLAPFRDRLVVLSGLSQTGPALRLGADPGAHSTAGSEFLTGVYPKKTSGADLRAGTSVDQIVAKEFGKHTQLASLEIGLDPADFIGGCETDWSCAYVNTISWRTPTTPNPMENNPRAVFERLFGDSNTTDPAERLGRIRMQRSILDFVSGQMDNLLAKLGESDNGKLGEYLDAIRDVERRIQMAEQQSAKELPKVDRPAGIPATFEEHAKLMFDLQVLAFQTDMTRVFTFMVGHELGGRTYREIGIPDPHHPLTHHAGDPDKIAKVIKINAYHVKNFAYFVNRLASTSDGGGSLLDHTILVYGGGISDGNVHAHDNLPISLVAGKDVNIKGGRHIMYPKEKNTPLSNLHLTLMDKLGIRVENFGESNGELELLSGV